MRLRAALWLSAVVTACLLSARASVAQHNTPAQIVITHVTVINPDTSSFQPNRTVVISGDRIVSVNDSKNSKKTDAHVIDATGQYLIPGLWDMHVHSAFGDWFPGGRDIILPLFVANGVTGVRDMGGDVTVLSEWRRQIARGEIVGPRMIISGPMLDGYLPDAKLRFPSSIAVTTPASAVAAVDSLKTQGVEFIKVQYAISHDMYRAAAAEAHQQSLPVVGHLPDKVRIQEGVEAGKKSIEH